MPRIENIQAKATAAAQALPAHVADKVAYLQSKNPEQSVTLRAWMSGTSHLNLLRKLVGEMQRGGSKGALLEYMRADYSRKYCRAVGSSGHGPNDPFRAWARRESHKVLVDLYVLEAIKSLQEQKLGGLEARVRGGATNIRAELEAGIPWKSVEAMVMRRLTAGHLRPITFGGENEVGNPPPVTHGGEDEVGHPPPVTHGGEDEVGNPPITTFGGEDEIGNPPITTFGGEDEIGNPPITTFGGEDEIGNPPITTFGGEDEIGNPPVITFGGEDGIGNPPPQTHGGEDEIGNPELPPQFPPEIFGRK